MKLNGTPTFCTVYMHDPKLGPRELYRGTRSQCEWYLDSMIRDDELADCYIDDPAQAG